MLVFLVGLASGEGGRLAAGRFSPTSLAALVYLILFGSLLAFTAYTWLLQNAPISLVATYAFVNPVVAVLLGALLLREEITLPIVAGATLIIASVAFVVRKEAGTSERDTTPETSREIASPAHTASADRS